MKQKPAGGTHPIGTPGAVGTAVAEQVPIPQPANTHRPSTGRLYGTHTAAVLPGDVTQEGMLQNSGSSAPAQLEPLVGPNPGVLVTVGLRLSEPHVPAPSQPTVLQPLTSLSAPHPSPTTGVAPTR
jgi:hypothetical protein